MLSDAALKDLHRLAIARVEEACNSVGQLLDDEEQGLCLLISVLSSVSMNAAQLMHKATTKVDGTKPAPSECFAQVLAIIAEQAGLDATVLSEDEARARGMIKN